MGIASLFRKLGTCRSHDAGGGAAQAAAKVLIVGSPNVGKSALFNRLTGRYVTVSNYPGTTVEVSRGRSRLLGDGFEVVDTPGMYSLLPITEEERVARELLLDEAPHAVVHVVDAKNLDRMLGLTLQLAEAGLPLVLALNMADEAEQAGMRIDLARIEEALGVPVVRTVATRGDGLADLAGRIREARPAGSRPEMNYGPVVEEAIAAVGARLRPAPGLSTRSRAVLLLQGDGRQRDRLRDAEGDEAVEAVARIARAAGARLDHAVHYHVAAAVRLQVDCLLAEAVTSAEAGRTGAGEWLSRLSMHPATGLPLLAVVVYVGLYKFVGGFGAGFLVDRLEGTVFEGYVNPWVNRTLEGIVPWQVVRDLVGGEYGVITLGVRYAVAIVLPIVGTFFVAFSVLEDSGYLPRLAMLVDRVFKKIGLNGRAVIPMVLGFGCDTMATMVTRTLETRRERMIAILLLALAIPCSAQMGVILGLLAGHPGALLVWAGVVAGVFLVVGSLAARLMPGERPRFYMELPPLRFPRPMNVVVKTYTRMVWYFKEVLPLFILASVLIWIGQVTGLFGWIVGGIEPLVRALGLPDGAAVAFLFGFFRRDYGAAGLYDIRGGLSGNQLAVAAITLTLFLPCIAQLLVMKKEQGWRASLVTAAFVFVVAFAVGFAVNAVLVVTEVQL